jgi:hypothetical protein
MNRFSRKLSILAIGLAMGVAVPAFAADEDAANKTVPRGDVPAAVQQTIQQRIPAGAEVTEYVRRGNGANQIYAAHFKQPGQKGQQKIFVSSGGQFLLGPIPGDEKVTQAQIERAAAAAAAAPATAAPATATPPPAAGSLTPDQARAQINELQARENVLTTDIDQRTSQIRQADQQIRDLQARGGASANGQIDSLRAQQREWQTISDRNRTELATNEQRQRQVAAAGGIDLPSNPQLAASRLPGGVGAPPADPLYDRDRDDQAANPRFSRVNADQVPPAARTALDKYTRDQRDVEYRRDQEGNQVFYTAHYVTNDGNRHWLTVNENGTPRVGPKISVYPTGQGTDAARTASGQVPAAAAPPDAGYRTIPQSEVPKAVVQGATRVADGQGGHDWQFLQSERSGQTNYSVLYTDKNNRRMEARLDSKGNVIEQPHAASAQPPAAGHAPAPAPGHETPASNTPHAIDQRDVPKAVTQTVTREANNQGGHDWQYFRVGQDDYLVRYTTKDNKQMETRIDNSGKVVEAPHAVK